MTKKELIEQLRECDDSEVWFQHKLKGEIMPAEITVKVNSVVFTADGIVLSDST